MTALKKFARLEATGLWRADPSAQRREVYVLFRDMSLVITDANDTALSHWALTAVVRRNPGEMPAQFAPDAEVEETLEIDDEVMVSAIEQVQAALARSKPRRGRLRLAFGLALAAGIAALAWLWLPGAILSHTLSVVPEAKRVQIGRALLAEIVVQTGPHCADPAGDSALTRLRRRVIPEFRGQALVLPGLGADSLLLPGGFILLGSAMVERASAPEAVAGFLIREALARRLADPLARLLAEAGTAATFRLLTTGDLPDEAIATHARRLLANPPAPPDPMLLLPAFEAAGIGTAPFAFTLDRSGESVLDLIEADPFRGRTYRAPLSDAGWVALQGICAG